MINNIILVIYNHYEKVFIKQDYLIGYDFTHIRYIIIVGSWSACFCDV